ncbi:MAG: glycoside hydrolase family 3 C-terminal domain-containing protein [Steroidobacteraceae bacterium]
MNKSLLLIVLAGVALPVLAADAPSAEPRVDALLAKLIQREKIALMSGGSSFGTAAVERVGIPALRFADGPNGVRSNDDEPATVFPTGVAVAATWNPVVVQEMGEAIGREARSLGVHVLLGPNVNIQRTPLAGRNFEAYSEDPFLAGRIGTGFVRGVQSQGVGTSVKHYVGNEQELERLRSSSNVDERTLREIYLTPFEMIVRDAKPWTVMAAYNRVNGTYMTEHVPLVRGVLKGEWGFDGVLMSDWGAVQTTTEAANGGTDLEMPGPPRYFGGNLFAATRSWRVEQPVIDEAARRMVRLVERTGGLDAKAVAHKPGQRRDSGSAAHRGIAQQVAEEAIVLLRNEGGVLPLERGKARRIAVIGPNADIPLQQGGGSAAVVPSVLATPLERLREVAGRDVTLTYAQGVDNDLMAPPIDHRQLSPDRARSRTGLATRYWSGAKAEGTPFYSGTETYFDKTMFASEFQQMTARWEGFFWPTRDGEHEFRIAARGDGRLAIDGREIIGPNTGTAMAAESDFQASGKTARVSLKKGRGYAIRLDYVSAPVSFHQMHLAVRLPTPSFDEAVAAARDADAAVVFVGVSRTSESEGRDRADMDMVGRQSELVEAVLAANPRTVVVLNNGEPLMLPWAERVPALLAAWLPGQEGGAAIARVLFGEVNPSGKLPFTFPRRVEDTPTWTSYGAGRDANYGEGVFVGYRWYDRRRIEPLFPFGHGLSYTRFEYANLVVPAKVDRGPVEVTLDVRNAGSRAGSEVVQLYVGDTATTEVVRPPHELKGFAKVTLAPGETRRVSFTLSARDLSYFDPHVRGWVATPGEYRIAVGSSSRDLRLTRPLQWNAPRDPRLPDAGRASFGDGF